MSQELSTSFVDPAISTVLIVEDDQPLRSTLAATLTMCGFRVSEARTGEEALAVASVNAPDLYLVDLRGRVRRHLSSVPEPLN